VDILKAEFPLDIQKYPEIGKWKEACETLTKTSCAPWILLSASVDFEVFLQQVSAACMGGASGVAVGRAVWKEATDLKGTERIHFLKDVAAPRMRQVRDLVNALGIPWTSCYQTADIDENWFKSY
jgi:tagatose-1,6-bisphosphate aldolase